MTCQWCGDAHPADRLCGRAQWGLTRRSFCFLFAGLAAAALPVPAWPSDLGPVAVPVNASTVIHSYLSAPTTATFRSRDRALRPGQAITVSLPDWGLLFSGTVDAVKALPDGSREIHAVDHAEYSARTPDAYGLFREWARA